MTDAAWSRQAPLWISCALVSTAMFAFAGIYWPALGLVAAAFRPSRQPWAVLGTLALPFAAVAVLLAHHP